MMQTLILDFGNVIAFFDHTPVIKELAAYSSLAEQELRTLLYGSPLEDAYERGQLSTDEYFAEAQRQAGLTCSLEVFEEAFVRIFTRNPAVCDWIPRLATQYRLVLASNTNTAHFRQIEQQFADVLRWFDLIGTSFTIGHRKPEPAYYAWIHERLSCDPSCVYFVDDLEKNVRGAELLGWHGLVYHPGREFPGELSRMGIQIPPANP